MPREKTSLNECNGARIENGASTKMNSIALSCFDALLLGFVFCLGHLGGCSDENTNDLERTQTSRDVLDYLGLLATGWSGVWVWQNVTISFNWLPASEAIAYAAYPALALSTEHIFPGDFSFTAELEAFVIFC